MLSLLILASLGTFYFDIYLVEAVFHQSGSSALPARKQMRSQLYLKLVVIALMGMFQFAVIITKAISDNIPVNVMSSVVGIVSAWLVIRIYTVFSFVDQLYHAFQQTSASFIPLQHAPNSIEFRATLANRLRFMSTGFFRVFLEKTKRTCRI